MAVLPHLTGPQPVNFYRHGRHSHVAPIHMLANINLSTRQTWHAATPAHARALWNGNDLAALQNPLPLKARWMLQLSLSTTYFCNLGWVRERMHAGPKGGWDICRAELQSIHPTWHKLPSCPAYLFILR